MWPKMKSSPAQHGPTQTLKLILKSGLKLKRPKMETWLGLAFAVTKKPQPWSGPGNAAPT
jgi:hypothetical protein